MRTLVDNLKIVLCDLALKTGSMEQAYAELIGVFDANAHDIYARGEELGNKLKSEGKPESYIKLRLNAFSIAYDREMHCLHITRQLHAEGYRG